MKNLIAGAAAALALVAVAGTASAEMWVDYTPKTEIRQITDVRVAPGNIDDYLVGLKKTWVPGNEIAKKKGLITDYKVLVKMNAADGLANVRLVIVYPNLAALQPNKERDQAIDKEVEAILSRDKSDAAVAGYNKYREFVGEGFWSEVEYTK